MSESYEGRLRIDFKMEITDTDQETGVVGFYLIPDPDRYEWTDRDGERFLYDRLDFCFFPEHLIKEAVVQILEGSPVFLERQLIDDASEYARSRGPAIDSALRGGEETEAGPEGAVEFLRTVSGQEHGFVILCVDLAGSTMLATTLDPADYVRLIRTALNELARVVPLFHGHVLKFTGDGLVAYFPEPSFIRKNDLGIDCALTMHRVVYEALNPSLMRAGLPTVNIRVGMEGGAAHVVALGSQADGKLDILGAVVSLAAKIQATAPEGGVRVGQVAMQNLHTSWRLRCTEAAAPGNWPYRDERNQPYRIFDVS